MFYLVKKFAECPSNWRMICTPMCPNVSVLKCIQLMISTFIFWSPKTKYSRYFQVFTFCSLLVLNSSFHCLKNSVAILETLLKNCHLNLLIFVKMDVIDMSFLSMFYFIFLKIITLFILILNVICLKLNIYDLKKWY